MDKLCCEGEKHFFFGFVVVCERGVTIDLVFVDVFLLLFAKIGHKVVVKNSGARYVNLTYLAPK